MTEQQEKKNQRIAMLGSLAVHTAIFLAFFFMVAWRAPNPPAPEYGIELNFGTDDAGSGDIQPETPVGSDGTAEEEPTQPEPEEEKPKEEAKTQETKPVEQEIISKVESPVTVEEKKVEEKKEEIKQPEKPKEKVPDPKKEEVKPKVDNNAVYKSKSQSTESTNKTSEAKQGTGEGNHGDDKDKKGDKGDPQGSLDAKSLYGKQGGGGGDGSSLELSGWTWDKKPSPAVPDNESGKVVFEIKVDASGEIISIKTLERSVSIEAEQACKRELEKLTFTKTGTNVPALSTGKVTITIRAN